MAVLKYKDRATGAWLPSGSAPGNGVSSWNDLTDRPFYSEVAVGTVLAETSPAFDEDTSAFSITDPISLTTGNEYTVKWNGTEYTCVCGDVELDSMMCQYLGNTSVMGGDDTGEPFFMVFLPPEVAATEPYTAQIMPLDGSTELTISITGMVETVTTIPEKYLPKPLLLYVDDTNYLCKQKNLSEDSRLTYSELQNAVLSGRTIMVVASVLTDLGLSTQYCPGIPWLFTDAGYGSLQVSMATSDVAHSRRTYYTVEYTATT